MGSDNEPADYVLSLFNDPGKKIIKGVQHRESGSFLFMFYHSSMILVKNNNN